MRAQEILAHSRKAPFIPIRFFLSDGSKHDVRHPEFLMISPREVVIGVPSPEVGMAARMVHIDPIHITRIEPINGKRPHARKSR